MSKTAMPYAGLNLKIEMSIQSPLYTFQLINTVHSGDALQQCIEFPHTDFGVSSQL